MHSFFIEPNLITEGQVIFPSDLAHQVLDVLRLVEGDQVEVLDNQGSRMLVELAYGETPKQVIGKILSKENATKNQMASVSLFFGLTSRDKTEWILQKGTEIGVTTFHPFISSRTVVQSTTLSEKKIERWKRIIREAAEQSRRNRLPEFHLPENYESCLCNAKAENDLCLLAWEKALFKTHYLSEILNSDKPASIAVFVGPEGGFSDDEVALATQQGITVISLGNQILRMETAAMVLPALILYELGIL
jgi:16S rRNA (uracil1498-N3)-methyltransferase